MMVVCNIVNVLVGNQQGAETASSGEAVVIEFAGEGELARREREREGERQKTTMLAPKPNIFDFLFAPLLLKLHHVILILLPC